MPSFHGRGWTVRRELLHCSSAQMVTARRGCAGHQATAERRTTSSHARDLSDHPNDIDGHFAAMPCARLPRAVDGSWLNNYAVRRTTVTTKPPLRMVPHGIGSLSSAEPSVPNRLQLGDVPQITPDTALDLGSVLQVDVRRRRQLTLPSGPCWIPTDAPRRCRHRKPRTRASMSVRSYELRSGGRS